MAQAHLGATSKPTRRGFTLVELVVVLAVIAVVSAIAVPRFASAATRARLDAAASRVVQDIGIVAASATAAGADRQIVYAPSTDLYVMMGVPSRGSLVNRQVSLGASPYEINLVSASFEGMPLLVFNGHGVAETDGAINLAAGKLGKRILLTGGSTTVQVDTVELNTRGDGNTMPTVRSVIAQVTVDSGTADAASLGKLR